MKVWKTKKGEKITAKEFAKRFKSGINNITPIQKLQNEQRATLISFTGYLVGLVSLIVFIKGFPNTWLVYGLILIFVGSAYSSAIKFLGIRQQLRFFKNMDENSSSIGDILDSLDSPEDDLPEIPEPPKPEESNSVPTENNKGGGE